MNKSEIFKTAHNLAKNTAKAIGDYRIALSLALKAIHDHMKTARGERVRVNGKVTYLKPVFSDKNAQEYIKKNSRVVVKFDSIASYNAAHASGVVGEFWFDGDDVLAYQYF